MSDLEMFADTLALIREADNIQALNQCMFAIRDAYGVANVAYHAVSIPGRNDTIPMLLQTYDSAWVNRYIELGYLRSDPVVQVTRRSLLPLDWIDIERSAPGAREFFSDADRFGVGRNGLSFPIRLPSQPTSPTRYGAPYASEAYATSKRSATTSTTRWCGSSGFNRLNRHGLHPRRRGVASKPSDGDIRRSRSPPRCACPIVPCGSICMPRGRNCPA
jgi:hypothetical protein